MKGQTNTQTNTPQKWGVSAAEFHAGLRGKSVQIVTLDGKLYKGALVGVDTYDLIIKQPNDLVILIAKHAVKLISAE